MNRADSVVKFLAAATLNREEIDRFLDPHRPSWARFDSQLGYLPNDSTVPDNIDGSLSEYRYGRLGERLQINHSSQPTRINTYGDSFTQCHQVSDGETWQEVLAAHFGEPIRNFGVGGFGVYQASERLRRVEGGDGSAPYVILNIFLDDHYRNIDAYRLLRLGNWWRDYDRSLTTSMFHANPWEHARIDPATGAAVRRENVCPTPESLYELCDTDFLLDRFGGDFVVQKLVADLTGDYSYLEDQVELAQCFDIPLERGAADPAIAHQLWERSAFAVTEQLVQELQKDLASEGKKLMVLLTYPADAVIEYVSTGRRVDQQIVDSLAGLGIPFIDGLALHAEDYRNFSITPEAYARRYYAGHYTPLGNANFAFMIKQRLVEWLDPAPPAYANVESSFAVQAGRLA